MSRCETVPRFASDCLDRRSIQSSEKSFKFTFHPCSKQHKTEVLKNKALIGKPCVLRFLIFRNFSFASFKRRLRGNLVDFWLDFISLRSKEKARRSVSYFGTFCQCLILWHFLPFVSVSYCGTFCHLPVSHIVALFAIRQCLILWHFLPFASVSYCGTFCHSPVSHVVALFAICQCLILWHFLPFVSVSYCGTFCHSPVSHIVALFTIRQCLIL